VCFLAIGELEYTVSHRKLIEQEAAMRLTASLLSSLCVVGLLQSFSALAQTQASSTSATSATSASSSKPEITADDKRMIAQGYTLKMNKGQKVFCKLQTEMGSHFQKSVCRTAEEWQQIAELGQDSTGQRVHVGGGSH
jgi:hypothetical protein